MCPSRVAAPLPSDTQGVDEGGATAACPSADLRDFGVDAEGRRVHIACGAKMDDTGAVDPALGGTYAQLWRDGVLRRCYESGRLAIIGGGGGGAGGGACCGGVPRINFGFGFRAELKPAQALARTSEGPASALSTEKAVLGGLVILVAGGWSRWLLRNTAYLGPPGEATKH